MLYQFNHQMKKIFFTVVVLLMATSLFAQQDPYYTQWMFNRLAYNPAYAGTQKGVELTALHHMQWVGYEAKQAPQTQNITASMPFGNHGVGLNVFFDRAGFEKTMNTSISYNYKFAIGSGKLAVGPSVGFIQKSLDGTRLRPENVNDPYIPATSVSTIRPDFGIGAYYSNEAFYNFYAGISSLHLTQEDFQYETTNGSKVQYLGRRHYYATAGMELPVSPVLLLRPNVLFKNDGATSQLDVNLDLLYNEKLRGGVSYRTNEAVSLLVGYYPATNLHIGYSYDITLSNLNRYSNGSHEILLTYLIGRKQAPTIKTRRPAGSPRFLE